MVVKLEFAAMVVGFAGTGNPQVLFLNITASPSLRANQCDMKSSYSLSSKCYRTSYTRSLSNFVAHGVAYVWPSFCQDEEWMQQQQQKSRTHTRIAKSRHLIRRLGPQQKNRKSIILK
ncbi:hypothetical protein ACH5RR_013653 [Cinchona calisaya]|uniref:Secreted protein n=1 Tax=Cinchona calisaya TaxID=153742 RepID=A0ABD3A2X0_9GENT